MGHSYCQQCLPSYLLDSYNRDFKVALADTVKYYLNRIMKQNVQQVVIFGSSLASILKSST